MDSQPIASPCFLRAVREPRSPIETTSRRTLASFKSRLTADDTLLVVLIGHGTFDGTAAKFNLVGPDMDSREWKASLEGNPARLVFVNTTSSSFQFVAALSGKNRIVIAATDSAGQKYATMFPQYFIEALDQSAKADNDKNGRLSVWEAFAYASQAVKQAFEKQGTLVTERSVIDDNGDGVGREAAAAAGTDGVLAKTTFLDPLPASSSGNAALAGLEKRRITLEAEIEQLKAKKGEMPAGQCTRERIRTAASPSSSPIWIAYRQARSPCRSDEGLQGLDEPGRSLTRSTTRFHPPGSCC